MTSSPTTSNGLTAMTVDGFGGTLLLPGDAAYDDARRVNNTLLDRHPVAIARCRSADDVAAPWSQARRGGTRRHRARGWPGCVRTGGGRWGHVHRPARDDGHRRRPRVEDGPSRGRRGVGRLRCSDPGARTRRHGRPGVDDAGSPDSSLGSGSGWLERSLGSTGDSLVSAEVVTADGRHVQASERENPGLFWGLRGGSGNFGIVTAFHFALHPVGPTVLAGMLTYPADAGATTSSLTTATSWHRRRTSSVGASCSRRPGAAMTCRTHLRRPSRGDASWCATPARSTTATRDRALARVRSARRRHRASRRATSTCSGRSTRIDSAPGRHFWSADYLTELPDAAITTLAAHRREPGLVALDRPAGSRRRCRRPRSADCDRPRATDRQPGPCTTCRRGPTRPSRPATSAHTRAMSAAMTPWATGRAHVDYLGDESHGRVASAYGPEQYARLAALKKTWDPDNVLHHTPNIPPA